MVEITKNETAATGSISERSWDRSGSVSYTHLDLTCICQRGHLNCVIKFNSCAVSCFVSKISANRYTNLSNFIYLDFSRYEAI